MQLLKNKTKKEKVLLGGITFIFAGFVALIAAYILHMDSRTINADLYVYDAGHRLDYTGHTKIFRTDDRLVLRNGENEVVLTSAPLYYKNRARLFLPEVMAAYLPSQNLFGKLNYFTEIYRDKDGVFTEKAYRKIPLGNGFLYDGADLYLFIEKAVVKWKDRSVLLEPFSYAIVIYNKSLEIYSSDGGTSIVENTGNCMVTAEMGSGYSVNLSTDILCRAGGKEQLLFSQPSKLKELE